MALFLVDLGHQVGGEVDDLFQLLGLQLLLGLGAHEQIGQPRSGAPQVPDVDRGGGELDVAHPIAAHLGTGYLYAAPLADDALEADALVLAAVALPVFGGPEDLLAEQPVLFRTERAVVDGLGLLYLAIGPSPNGIGSGQPNGELIESVDVQHLERPPCDAALVFII